MFALFVSVFLSASAAWAIGNDWQVVSGQTRSGEECSIYYNFFQDRQGDKVEMALRFDDYSFTRLIALTETNPIELERILVDQGGGRYAAPIGAPITLFGVGLLTLEAEIRFDAETEKPVSVVAKAKGHGAFSWWSKGFNCKF